MACKLLFLGWLTIAVPPGHSAGGVETDRYDDANGKAGLTVHEWSTSISGGSPHATATVTVWDGPAPRRGQPAETLKTVEAEVRGGKVEILHRRQPSEPRVFTVAYPRQPGGEGWAVVRVDGTSFGRGARLVTRLLGGGICK